LAEEGLRQAEGGPGLNWSIGDLDGDGRDELLVTTPALTLSFRPSAGGSLTECGYRPKRLDLADVLTRRAEAYHRKLKEKVEGEGSGEVKTIHEEAAAKEEGLHALLHYDRLRRGMLQEFLLPPEGSISALAPWENALRVFPELEAALDVSSRPELVEARFSFDENDSWPFRVMKTVAIEGGGARMRVHYRLVLLGNLPLEARWGCQWNIALTAGNAEGRYFDIPGNPGLGTAGSLEGARAVGLVDEWIGLEARFRAEPGAALSFHPVETVSLSEAGYERLYQGTALLFTWPIALEPGAEWEANISFEIQERARTL
jgi:alpha-amylase